MEAAPHLPMIGFELLSSTENIQFGKKLKHYIASFYNEDPEGYITEISKLDSLRVSAAHPSHDVTGIQTLKKYYCQLHFLKSRFPMEHDQHCFMEFEWRDCQNNVASGDINFELMAVLFNIGVLHTILGANDSRSSPEGMKLACSHFQCAVWAFQTLKEKHGDLVPYMMTAEGPNFYKQVCLAQAQECILEKSMLDNRKSTIISKVAVQVWDYYRNSLSSLKALNADTVGRSRYKEWTKYLQFKIAYHRCISLLFQGQQAEELQKMGERVAFYQGACDHLQEVYKYLNIKQEKELADALAFTADVVEGKRKAAKNENEYIYHEEVPDIANLQEAKGASLVKGIEFNVNDPEVSGSDIFARLVPMEAHEAASVYSEKKAEVLRNIGQRVEIKDQSLVEFMSSMQLDMLTKMHQATGIPQELIDRAASLSAKPNALQDLIDSMAKLSNIYHDVEANLGEIDVLLKDEEENERSYQEIMGKRPPSIITTDLARESAKYKEAHTKAKESNETLSKAMMTHLENLKILQRPIRELQQKLPSVELPDANIDQNALQELEMLNGKVDEMKTQRAMLWAQLRDAIHNDDITNALVTKQPNQAVDDVFRKQLEKHSQLIDVLDQNLGAQDNIKKAFVDCYAKTLNTRRYIQDIIQKRNSTIQALIASHDSYDDLLAKAMKGIEFYTKLELNVSKLLQRIKSASKVQQEEREQMLAKSVSKKEEISVTPVTVNTAATAPKLKDYLEARKKASTMGGYPTLNYGAVPQNVNDTQNWPPGVRPAPVGSEITDPVTGGMSNEAAASAVYYQHQINPNYSQTGLNNTYPANPNLTQAAQYGTNNTEMSNLTDRMGALLGKTPVSSQYNPQYTYSQSNYTPHSQTYPPHYTNVQEVQSPASSQDAGKASTLTTNSYQTISSYTPKVPEGSNTITHMQYPDSSLKQSGNMGYQYPGYNQMQSSQTPNNAYQASVSQAPNQSSVSQYGQHQYSQGQYPSAGQTQQYQISGQYPQGQSAFAQYPQSQTPQQHYPQSATPQPYSQSATAQQQYSQNQPFHHVVSQNQYGQNANPYSQNQTPSYQYSQSQSANQYLNPNTVAESYGSKTQSPAVSPTVSQSNTQIQPVSREGSNTQLPSVDSQIYGAPSTISSGSAYPQYQNTNYPSQHQSNSSQQTYFPQGYAPNYNSPLNTPSENTNGIRQYHQQYYTQEHSSSVSPNICNRNFSTYSSPIGDPYKVQSGSTNPYMSSTGAPNSYAATSTVSGTVTGNLSQSYNNYSSVYGYSQASYASTMTSSSYTYPTSSPQVIKNTAPQANMATKESNVDLLTGLDFSAESNIPTLTPQLNILPDIPKEPEKKPTIVEVKPPQPGPKAMEASVGSPKKEPIRVLPSKPLNNAEVKALFNQELEKYEKYVESLTSKTLSGPTALDVKWKEIQESQELDNQKRIISVARCYHMKNRFPDILPYDYSRIELKTTSDDYINASFVKQISPFGPQFIVTQAPLMSTVGDFWAMVKEQHIELIFCVLNDNEIGADIYWPKEKGQNQTILNQNLVLSLQSIIVKPHWTERLISLTIPEKKESWVVMHVQFTSWPGSLFPTSAEPFVSYVLELISLFQQQKSVSHPILVHCSSGIGRSGLMCLLSNAILDVTNQCNSIPDLSALTSKLGNFRKNILRDREHLKFAYEAMLCYMKQVLMQDNMKKKLNDVVPIKQEETKPSVPEAPEKIIDPLSTLDPFWASKK